MSDKAILRITAFHMCLCVCVCVMINKSLPENDIVLFY